MCVAPRKNSASLFGTESANSWLAACFIAGFLAGASGFHAGFATGFLAGASGFHELFNFRPPS
jgi:ABC-type uncharacterized transport system permease subunit